MLPERSKTPGQIYGFHRVDRPWCEGGRTLVRPMAPALFTVRKWACPNWLSRTSCAPQTRTPAAPTGVACRRRVEHTKCGRATKLGQAPCCVGRGRVVAPAPEQQPGRASLRSSAIERERGECSRIASFRPPLRLLRSHSCSCLPCTPSGPAPCIDRRRSSRRASETNTG